MSENEPVRRRRADAERSRSAILAAALELLDEHPDAGLERIAEAAHVTRQTVYAHFPSRDALLNAVLGELTAETLRAVDDLDLDHGSAFGNTLGLIDLAWRTFERHPLLLHVPAGHDPVAERLEQLIRRGQREGEITRELPVHWLASTLISLGRTAGDSVAAGRLTARAAYKTLHTTLTRIPQP
ncbi:TetR/AcrR family transcriptional regulator [Kribbella sp. GL6]|uniref:TetR/AcrR family transcriptional regulator n=1 Tax=Kribbella sp. GL6 TaxID=3419765 RepID=UPI003D010A75